MHVFALLCVSFAKCFAETPNYITDDEFAAVKGKKIEISNTSLPVSRDTLNKFEQNGRPGFGTRLWDNAIVPYTLDPSFNNDQRQKVAQAIQAYHDNTCIRFVPKQNNHPSWVDILNDPNVCGLAHMCRNTGAQFAKFGGGCITPGVMVHELGHTLCMGHEQTRMDRDQWIDWDTSKCQPHGKDDLNRGLHKLYDYVSIEHYEGECYNGCIKPKQPGVTKCGSGGPLSVLDIEILNEMYGCNSGCHGYRYVNSKNQLVNPVEFGNELNGDVLYSCRGYYNGDIIPGKYHAGWKQCHVAYGGQERRLTGDHIEVLTNPHNVNIGWRRSNTPPANAIRGGRNNERVTLYAVSCLITVNNKQIWASGNYHPSGGAYTSYGGREIKCSPGQISFPVCN